jgi:L-lactate dehydrogenase
MKVGIIGSGFVGATTAYTLVMKGVGREIVLVDLNKARSQGEADDILHATPFAHPINVRAGDYVDLKGCKVVVITAGASQRPGESRLELLGRNAAIFRDIIPRILSHAPEAVLLVTTNPVDIMTHLAARYAKEFGIPGTHVLGSGTTLDTARFRALLGRHVGVDAQHVHAYVIGEHGDSEVLTWSLATVGGTPLIEFCRQHHFEFTNEQHQQIEQQVRRAAYDIIEAKGATYYGIASALARIVDVILRDQRSIMTVCTPMEEAAGVRDVTLALPNLVGGSGVLDHFPLNLADNEYRQLQRSAQVIRQAIESLDESQA